MIHSSQVLEGTSPIGMVSVINAPGAATEERSPVLRAVCAGPSTTTGCGAGLASGAGEMGWHPRRMPLPQVGLQLALQFHVLKCERVWRLYG